jgi:hypothetical protein
MCVTAFAPGTTSPSMAVVKKILFPQTTGDGVSSPGNRGSPLMIFGGTPFPGQVRLGRDAGASGPRHCGQLAAPAVLVNTTTDERRTMTKISLISEEVFMFDSLVL